MLYVDLLIYEQLMKGWGNIGYIAGIFQFAELIDMGNCPINCCSQTGCKTYL